MRAAFALRIISGKKIFIFGIAERLRALRYPIFTGGVVTVNGSCSVAAMVTFCLPSACRDAPLGQR